MHLFIRGPNDYDEDEDDDEFVDPDLVEPVFFPVELVELGEVDDEEDVEHEDVTDGDDDDEDDADYEEEEGEDDDDSDIVDNISDPPSQLHADFSRNGDIASGVEEDDNDSIVSLVSPLGNAGSEPPTHVVNSTTSTDPSGPDRTGGLEAISLRSASDGTVEVGTVTGEATGVCCETQATMTMKRIHDTSHSDSDSDQQDRESKRPTKDVDEDVSCQGQTEDVYSNPFISAEEGVIEEEALRGDRIGQTIYSERHILKILMRWIEELPKYSAVGEGTIQRDIASDAEEEVEECESKKLERDFKKEMSLMWDMSSETDVMFYLVSKGIFGIIRDSLLASRCERLTEISLGILANVISNAEMAKELAKEDVNLKLIQTVVSVGCGTTSVPILLQVLAVLRRITWYMRHHSLVDTWISETVTSLNFQTMLTIILKGSTNRVLIKDSVMVVFSLLETFIPDGDEGDGGNMDPRVETLATEQLVPALCEGLQELLKVPDDEAAMADLIDDVQRIPPHLQLGLRSGLGALCYIQKIPTGKVTLCAEKEAVIRFLIEYFTEFSKITEDLDREKAIEYLVAGLSLLACCHIEFSTIQPNAVLRPFAAAQKLMNTEDEENEIGVGYEAEVKAEKDDLSLAFALHEHLAQLRRTFGDEAVRRVFKTGNSTMIKFLESIDESVRVHVPKEKEVVCDA